MTLRALGYIIILLANALVILTSESLEVNAVALLPLSLATPDDSGEVRFNPNPTFQRVGPVELGVLTKVEAPILYRGERRNDVIPLFTEDAYEALKEKGHYLLTHGSCEGIADSIEERLCAGTFTFVPPQRYKVPTSQAVHSGDWNLLDFLQTICELRTFRGVLFRPPFSGPESLYNLDWRRGYRPNTTLLAAIQAHAQLLAQERAAQALSLAS